MGDALLKVGASAELTLNRGMSSAVSARVPDRSRSVLLATASAGGTLAAVRELGKLGFSVAVVASKRLSAAGWSRLATHSYVAPPERESKRFLERLLALGAAEPGRILLATSDETAWLYSLEAESLAVHFRIYQPGIATLRRILDKQLFAEAAVAASVATIPSWDPRTPEELLALAPSLPYPILIKPRTHVHRWQNDKGIVARSSSALVQFYQQFMVRESEGIADNPLMPDARRPLLQQFVNVAQEGVCSVSGFIDRSGELFVTRRATKVFLRSQPVGVGICFESLPADDSLSAAVRRLCNELGYFGMFEVEFIRHNNSWCVIDFNPRLFHQVGLDIHRGMPLPLFACLDASGEQGLLRQAVTAAQSEDEHFNPVFCDRFTLQLILTARRLTGRISRAELAYWRGWIRTHARQSVDVAAQDGDPLPWAIHALSEIGLGIKAVPRFWRFTPRVSERNTAAVTEGAQ